MSSADGQVRVGLVGLGNSGWFYHAQAHLAGSRDFELTAVCSEQAGRAQEAAAQFGGRPYTDWRQMVQAPDVELVVLALPHHLHRDVAVAAATAGKHVLVEKPIAVTTAEADEMIEAADQAGVLLSVFHQRRWEQDFQVIRQAVADGLIGDLWRVEVARTHAGRYRTAGTDQPHVGDDVLEWPHRRDCGGGISYLVAPHPVDQLLQLVGEPATTITGRVHQHPGDDVEHYIGIEAAFPSGVMGRVDVFRRAGIAPNRFAVYGTAGTLVSRKATEVEVVRVDAEPRSFSGLQPPTRQGDELYDGLFQAIRHGAPLPVTAQQGRDAVEVLELALRSAAQGGVPLATGRAARPR